jgi:hypothetical protein
MKRSLCCALSLVFLATLTVAPEPRQVLAQDADLGVTPRPISPEEAQQIIDQQSFGGGRGGRGGRGGARVGGGFGGRSMALADPAPRAEENAEILQLRLWVLSIRLSAEQAQNETLRNLVTEATNLPQTIESTNAFRELVAKLTKAQILQRSREYRIAAAVGQTAQLTNGSQRPVITNTTLSGRGGGGGRVNTYQYHSVGTSISVTPRIESMGLLSIALNFNDSDLAESDRSVPVAELDGAKPVMIPEITSVQLQTNVRLKRGGAAIVQTDTSSDSASGIVEAKLIVLGETREGASN